MSTPTQPDQTGRPPLVSAAEVGAALGKSPGSIRRWTRAGLIPHVSVSYSGAYEYDLEQVRAVADRDLRHVRRPAGTR